MLLNADYDAITQGPILQSLILGSNIFAVPGLTCVLIGFVSDMVNANRQTLEEVRRTVNLVNMKVLALESQRICQTSYTISDFV